MLRSFLVGGSSRRRTASALRVRDRRPAEWLGVRVARPGALTKDPLERADVIFVLGGVGWTRRRRRRSVSRGLRASHRPVAPTAGQCGELPAATGAEDSVRDGCPEERDGADGRARERHRDHVGDAQTTRLARAPRFGSYSSRADGRGSSSSHRSSTPRARALRSGVVPGHELVVIVHATRYDPTDIDRWWEPRRNFRLGLFEAQKLLAYWMGLAD